LRNCQISPVCLINFISNSFRIRNDFFRIRLKVSGQTGCGSTTLLNKVRPKKVTKHLNCIFLLTESCVYFTLGRGSGASPREAGRDQQAEAQTHRPEDPGHPGGGAAGPPRPQRPHRPRQALRRPGQGLRYDGSAGGGYRNYRLQAAECSAQAAGQSSGKLP
jgi:hypothetical protein